MSEQLQNQNLPTEEELRARDDAIFNTVADFRNELDNPAEQPEAHVQVPEFSDVAAHDAENKPVDVDAIFDKRKSEIGLDPMSRQMVDMAPGTGRHRKEFNLDENKAGLQRDVFSSITDRKHRGLPEEHREAFGITAHYTGGKKNGESNEDNDSADSAGEDGDDYEYPGNPYDPLELQDGKDPVIDAAALARAEKAARNMPRQHYFSGHAAASGEQAMPEADGNNPPAQQRGRHRATGRRAARAIPDGQVAGNSSNDHAMTPTGHHLIPRQPEATPVTVTPEARRRDRIAARLGKLVDPETRSELRDARDEMVESWRKLRESFRGRRPGAAATGKLATMAAGVRSGASRAAGKTRQVASGGATIAKEMGGIAKGNANYALDLAYRKPEDQLTDQERKARPYVKGLGIAAGALAVSAGVLGANQLMSDSHADYGRETPTAAGAQQYGPQIPKTSETPAPTVSATPSHVAKPVAKPTVSASPTAIPSSPNLWANKPQVPENNADTSTPASQEQTHTKDLDHEQINFTTSKDGKVTHVTAKLHQGGTIEEAGRAAGLTATEVANAVNKAGITNQQAEHLPVGQQMNFDRQADGSYVVHLK